MKFSVDFIKATKVQAGGALNAGRSRGLIKPGELTKSIEARKKLMLKKKPIITKPVGDKAKMAALAEEGTKFMIKTGGKTVGCDSCGGALKKMQTGGPISTSKKNTSTSIAENLLRGFSETNINKPPQFIGYKTTKPKSVLKGRILPSPSPMKKPIIKKIPILTPKAI